MSKTKFGDICSKIGSGATPRGGKEVYCSDGTTFIRSQNVLDFSFSINGIAFINDLQAQQLKNATVEQGDVLLNITGDSVARACIMPYSLLPARVNQHVAIIRGKADKVNNRYLLYHLQYIKPILLSISSSGATRNAITKAMIEEIEIDLPSLDVQNEIVKILSCIDEKIEMNNKINDNLEKQGQILFEQLFFINANQNWIEGTLSDIALINPTRTLKKGTESIYVEMANLSTSGSFPSDWDSKPFSGGMKFTNGDTIMARITPCLENGKTAYINFLNDGEVAFGSTEYIVISPKPGYCNEMFYFLARKRDFVNYAVGNMNGTSGRQRVTSEAIGNYELKTPTLDILQKFASFAGPVMNIIMENSLENRILKQLRDLILPKLMSGEIDVAQINL